MKVTILNLAKSHQISTFLCRRIEAFGAVHADSVPGTEWELTVRNVFFFVEILAILEMIYFHFLFPGDSDKLGRQRSGTTGCHSTIQLMIVNISLGSSDLIRSSEH